MTTPRRASSASATPITVTRPSLPPLAELLPDLERIWASGHLTNGGPYHGELERALIQYLSVPQLSLFSNATIGLMTALKALRVHGEVITTPYSFVATAHSLVWNDIQPVFVDVEPFSLNLDPARIEAAITPRTTAIMPVHCYGNPCDVGAIQEIADHFNLKVIYDAAHAFGVDCLDGSSVLAHGDLSVLSFHATKVFNTFEGGAIVSQDAKTKSHIDHLKNFGFVNETTVVTAGINGKMNELQAAVGLLQLKYIDEAIGKRGQIDAAYRQRLADVPGITCIARAGSSRSNFAYFPILVDDDYPLSRDVLYERMKERNILGRRYFYPLISEFPMYRGLPSARPEGLPVATRASRQVICLPIYPDLTEADIDRVTDVIIEGARKLRHYEKIQAPVSAYGFSSEWVGPAAHRTWPDRAIA